VVERIVRLERRAKSIIDAETLEQTYQAVFALSLENAFTPDSVCFFVTPTIATTCKHSLEGEKVLGDFVWVKNRDTKRKMKVVHMDPVYDFALLEVVGNFTVPNCLTLESTPPQPGDRFVLAAYQIGIMEEMKEFQLSLGIVNCTAVKVSKHHLVYQGDTHPGDSGGALVVHEGKVIGIHLGGVNALQARLSQQLAVADRLNAAEDSIDGLIHGAAQGCVSLLAHVIIPALP
jgi:hypothetical protein